MESNKKVLVFIGFIAQASEQASIIRAREGRHRHRHFEFECND
jgi:hypothetical protein